jgi:hypothetical protein
MKRWIILVTVLGILLAASAVAWADPINVGGNFTSGSQTLGSAVYPGKGNPQGRPFQVAENCVLLLPINVGGN